MELVDKRKVDVDGNVKVAEPELQYDNFTPTLEGFHPLYDAVLLRELKLPDDSLIATPDAYAEPCLYCEVIAVGNGVNEDINDHDIARILRGIGTTIPFADRDGHYLTVHAQDIVGVWRR